MGTAVEFRRIVDFPSLPAATLRRLEEVAFWHQDAYHWYRVASVVRLGNSVSVTAEDSTVLRIDGSNQMVYVHRICCGEQLVDSLSVVPLASDSQTETSGGSLGSESQTETSEGNSRRTTSV